jgi:hypothetical protein
MSGDGSVRKALSGELSGLDNETTFTAIEFDATGGSVWTVTRDENGTPGARRSPLSPLPADDLDSFYTHAIESLPGQRLALVVRSARRYPADLVSVLRDRLDVQILDCETPLATLLRDTIRLSPLTIPYELVVLKRVPAGRPDAGRLRLDSTLLFPKDASSGFHAEVMVRCAPTDDRGTVFAVVTRVPVPGAPPSARRFGRIEVQSGTVPPGVHRLTAWLARPGHVRFELSGAPIALAQETRSWREITSDVPDRLADPYPVHLVCAIEVSGDERLVGLRIERLIDLIAEADTGSRPLKVSVVAYGPHSVEGTVPEEPATALTWATTPDLATRALRGLRGRKPRAREYPRAAQLECALAEITARLTLKEGRPTLVTAGSRPPHPQRVDGHTEIIPCRNRVSWQAQLRELDRLRGEHGGLTLGAICDKNAIGKIWRDLGRDAIEEVDVVDKTAFAARLRLRDPAWAVPFPLIEERGT